MRLCVNGSHLHSGRRRSWWRLRLHQQWSAGVTLHQNRDKMYIQGDWLHRKQIFLFIQGVSVPPLFFLSGFLGGIQKGSVTLFPANFYHFDKFNCQNGAIKAVLTPPKWQIILGLGVVSPPKRIFFLFLGVMRLGNILHLEKSPKSFIVFLLS